MFQPFGLGLNLLLKQIPLLAKPFRSILRQHCQFRCRISQAVAEAGTESEGDDD